MSQPKVSVIMSIYKEPIDWIKQSIDSILNQTFQDFELIIANDMPDRIENIELIKNYEHKDSRIKGIFNVANQGLAATLNICIQEAKGKYLARMDADDISFPRRLEKQVKFMDFNSSIGVCGAYIVTFGQKEHVKKYPLTHEECFLFFDSPFAHPCIMIRKNVIIDNNIRYDTGHKFTEDFDLWERLYPLTHFANIPEVLLRYRISNIQVSTAKAAEQYAVSAEIKRRAFNQYCKLHGIDFSLSTPIDLNQIKAYKRSVPKTVAFDSKRLLSYLYRSVKTNRFKTLIYLMFSGDFAKFNLIDSAKTIYTLAFMPKKAPFIS